MQCMEYFSMEHYCISVLNLHEDCLIGADREPLTDNHLPLTLFTFKHRTTLKCMHAVRSNAGLTKSFKTTTDTSNLGLTHGEEAKTPFIFSRYSWKTQHRQVHVLLRCNTSSS